jgi:endonuclease YncB( thermonuclease family)
LAVSAWLINGTYRVTGGLPGGDSTRFYPDDPQAFSSLGIAARRNSTGGATVRLAGVDALEIAYIPRGSGTSWHQPTELASAAAAGLATALGFDRVVRADGGPVVSSVPQAVAGHVLALGADVHGRVIGFGFPARRRGIADLSQVPLDAAGVRDSVNWMLVRQGLAYPVGFGRLRPEVRAELVAAAVHAGRQQRGVWPHDVTYRGFRLADREQLQDVLVLLPRLFRRLADYLDLEGPDGVNLSGFPAYLAARADRVVVLPEGWVTGFETVVEIRQQEVRVTVAAERVVFLDR